MAFNRERYKPPIRKNHCACVTNSGNRCNHNTDHGLPGICRICQDRHQPTTDLSDDSDCYDLTALDTIYWLDQEGTTSMTITTPVRTLPTFDYSRALATLNHIKSLPEGRWNQGEWALVDYTLGNVVGMRLQDIVAKAESAEDNICKTAFCFAGWATVQDNAIYTGGTTVYAVREEIENPSEYGLHYREDGIPRVEIKDRARRLFGITVAEADDLFSGGNSIQKIASVIEDIRRARAVNMTRSEWQIYNRSVETLASSLNSRATNYNDANARSLAAELVEWRKRAAMLLAQAS